MLNTTCKNIAKCNQIVSILEKDIMAIVKNSTNWLSYIAVVATKLNKAIRAGDSLA